MNEQLVIAVRLRLEQGIDGASVSAHTDEIARCAVYRIAKGAQHSRVRISQERFEDHPDAEEIMPDLIVARAAAGASFLLDTFGVIHLEDAG